MMHFHMQRFKFIVIELRFFKKKIKENMAKNVENMSYIINQLVFVYSWIFFTHSSP